MKLEEAKKEIKINGFYKHFKNKVYRVDDIIIFCGEELDEDGKAIVIYSDIVGNKYARMAKNFLSMVVPDIRELKTVKRFIFLDKKDKW